MGAFIKLTGGNSSPYKWATEGSHTTLCSSKISDILIGIDFIHPYHLNYDTETGGFFWKKSNEWPKGFSESRKLKP